jgi:hypothetical protein
MCVISKQQKRGGENPTGANAPQKSDKAKQANKYVNCNYDI